MNDRGNLNAANEPKAWETLAQAKAWPVLRDIDARWNQFSPVRHYELPLYVNTETRKVLEPEKWGTGFLSVRERELPGELYADLRELSPQAVLRDLYRPVRQFYVTPEEIEGTNVHNPLPLIFRDIRGARDIQPRPLIQSLTRVVREAQMRQRAFVNEPWKPIKSDDAPRNAIR